MTIGRPNQGKEYDGPALSKALREVNASMRGGMQWTPRVFTSLYTEPMQLGALRVAPIAILCGRVQSVNGPEVPVSAAGALVHFVWEGVERGARITKIQGMTPSATEQYRFTFLIASQGGG
ncbi:MAG TPA: hypothetical protein VJ793_05795 [Anaerolineae bacterium]|nr:hypothetical protein [Anaerolineae bacterium]